MLADAIGAEHETTGAEGTLVQPLDRLGIAWDFGADGDGEIVHVAKAFSSEVDPGSR
jgi:hypothetical protein